MPTSRQRRTLDKLEDLPADGKPGDCPLCLLLHPAAKPGKATQYHEIWNLPHRGSKYDVDWSKIVYRQVWRIRICPLCNLYEANNHQHELLAIQAERLGREVVQAAIEEARALVKVKWTVPTLD